MNRELEVWWHTRILRHTTSTRITAHGVDVFCSCGDRF